MPSACERVYGALAVTFAVDTENMPKMGALVFIIVNLIG